MVAQRFDVSNQCLTAGVFWIYAPTKNVSDGSFRRIAAMLFGKRNTVSVVIRCETAFLDSQLYGHSVL